MIFNITWRNTESETCTCSYTQRSRSREGTKISLFPVSHWLTSWLEPTSNLREQPPTPPTLDVCMFIWVRACSSVWRICSVYVGYYASIIFEAKWPFAVPVPCRLTFDPCIPAQSLGFSLEATWSATGPRPPSIFQQHPSLRSTTEIAWVTLVKHFFFPLMSLIMQYINGKSMKTDSRSLIQISLYCVSLYIFLGYKQQVSCMQTFFFNNNL